MISALNDPHARGLLTRLSEYRNYWFRSPKTWLALGEYLRGLDREVTIWVGGSWTGREGFSAGIVCEHAGVEEWRVVVHDTNSVYDNESAGVDRLSA
ncbi:hypothetical protein MOBUDSM44075_04233 [Mycolicibacterium obuense]|uniref:Uncharacterized protein n=1 Tax=Mycolicibacterium obuense TaxID=1807 RepID=A0A0J6VNM9_9MYCO|nr:hypothetical protein MOBUDSM44075_04233 [Mycolicibacterium obuense]